MCSSDLPFVEISDAQGLKIAQAWRDKVATAGDSNPLWYEPKNAVGDTINGKIEDMTVVTKDIDDMQMQLDAHLENVDPELKVLINDELKEAMSGIDKMVKSVDDFYKAAKAAAVCVMKGGG